MLAGETEDLILSGADALCTSSEVAFLVPLSASPQCLSSPTRSPTHPSMQSPNRPNTKTQYAPRTCTPRSVGTFVTTAENQTTSILDDTLGLVSSLGDRVLPYVNATVDELEAARAQLMALQAAAGLINANVTEIEQYRAWLVDAADPAVAGEVPQGALPRVTDEQLQAVDDGACCLLSSVQIMVASLIRPLSIAMLISPHVAPHPTHAPSHRQHGRKRGAGQRRVHGRDGLRRHGAAAAGGGAEPRQRHHGAAAAGPAGTGAGSDLRRARPDDGLPRPGAGRGGDVWRVLDAEDVGHHRRLPRAPAPPGASCLHAYCCCVFVFEFHSIEQAASTRLADG